LTVGEVQTAVIPVPTKKFYKIKIRAVGKRGDKLIPSEFSNELLAYSGAPLSTLNENFDDINNLTPYYTQGTTGTWGLTNVAFVSPPNSLTDSPNGDYKPKSDNFVIFAPVVVKAPNLTLSFEEIAIIDSSGDAGIISISRDFGRSWKDIAFIDMRRSAGFKDNVSQSQWFTEHRSLADFENDTVLIKFTLTSNPLKNKDGWYIDNLRLDASVDWVNDWFTSAEQFDANVSPNPTSGSSSLYLTIYCPGTLEVELIDILGRKIQTIFPTQKVFAGQVKFDLTFDNLIQGIYFVRIKFNNLMRSLPVVLMH